MPLVLRRVGKYEVLREIGRGGMATVYLARQTDLNRNVALKELSAVHLADPAFTERFLHESRMAATLSHPNIVTVHDYFEHDSTPYISMEFLERGSLRPRMGQLTLGQIAGVLEGLLAGLAHAAAHGIVHRDIKPENVMVTLEGGVKIADFGIGRVLSEAPEARRFMTSTGTAIGTPAYMAPEQAMAKAVGPATDLYSLGVMAYELILEEVPFSDSDTPIAVLLRHVNEPVPPPLTVKPDLDPELANWIEHLLQKEPSERPGSAAECWDALEEIIIRLLGPRWRRDARLLDSSPTGATARPLTPAPFHDEAGEQVSEPQGAVLAEAAAEYATYQPDVEPAVVQPTPKDELPARASEPEPEPPAPSESEQAEYATYHAPGEAPTPPPLEQVPDPETPPPVVEALPPVVQAPPPVVPEPEPEPEPVKSVATPPMAAGAELSATMAPRSAGQEKSFVLTDALARIGSKEGGRDRRWLWLVLGIVVALGGAVALAVLAFGKGGTSEATPKPLEKVSLVAPGSAVYASAPGGHVLLLSGNPLKVETSIKDPAGPQAVGFSGGLVYIADSKGLTGLRLTDLSPVQFFRFAGASGLATSRGGTLVAIRRTGAHDGQLCIVFRGRLRPCVDLQFAPSGVAVSHSDQIFVADREGGQIVYYSVEGGKLAVHPPIAVGPEPHGKLVELSGKLYVPIQRGVAVVDLQTLVKSGTIPLRATPTDISVVPSTGRLFAALYSKNRIAIIDTNAPNAAPRLVFTGRGPVAISRAAAATPAGSVLYVVNAGGQTISMLDQSTGRVLRTVKLAGLTSKINPVSVSPPSLSESSQAVTVSIPIAGGTLDPVSVAILDANISGGRASIAAWQGGILNHGGPPKTVGGLTVAIGHDAERALINLSAKAGAFTKLTVSPSPDGRSIKLTATKAVAPSPPPPPPPVTTVPTTTHYQPQPPPPPPTSTSSPTIIHPTVSS
jgi:serine/threonine protein kinase/DNA-binding beta-propeller fold protein YncE